MQPSINTCFAGIAEFARRMEKRRPGAQRPARWYLGTIYSGFGKSTRPQKRIYFGTKIATNRKTWSRKSELLLRMEAFQNFQTDRINDWRDKTDEIQKLKEEWDAYWFGTKRTGR